MLTPQEIQDKKFEKAVFGGYDMTMVDDFLDTVFSDYGALYKENAVLKGKMKVLVDKIEEYRSVDDAMRKTLLTAQNMANEMVDNAKSESEQMTQKAREAAEIELAEYRDRIAAEEMRLKSVKAEVAAFIESTAKLFDDSKARLFAIKEVQGIADIESEAAAHAVEEKPAASEIHTEDARHIMSDTQVYAKAEEVASPIPEVPEKPDPEIDGSSPFVEDIRNDPESMDILKGLSADRGVASDSSDEDTREIETRLFDVDLSQKDEDILDAIDGVSHDAEDAKKPKSKFKITELQFGSSYSLEDDE